MSTAGRAKATRQLDVYRHPWTEMRGAYPYLVILEHDSVPVSSNVIATPLVPPFRTSTSRLHPLLELHGKPMLLLTPLLGQFPRRLLRRPSANFSEFRPRIIAAVDMLFAGS